MAENRLNIPIGRNPLSDSAFRDRVSKYFLGDVKNSLGLELYDVTAEDEAKVFALVLEFPKETSAETFDRLVFRVDREGLEHLAYSLNEVLSEEA